MTTLSKFLTNPKVTIKDYLWYVDAELELWYSYVYSGLRNEIYRHTRKDQRYCQRKFCSWLSRRDRIRANYPEYFL